jgi:hypothetical protein
MQLAYLIVMLVAAAASAYSQYEAGQAASKAADYNAKVAESRAEWEQYRADILAQQIGAQADWAEHNAMIAEREAELGAAVELKRGRKLIGAQLARYGKAGVTMAGTPLLVMEETADDVELSALLLEYEGELEAWGHRSEAQQKRTEASLTTQLGSTQSDILRAGAEIQRLRGETAKRTGTLQAGSTLLAGAAQGYAGYSALKEK